jgi:hypothetical protein
MGAGSSRCDAKPGDAFCVKDVSPQPRVVLRFDRVMAPSSVFRDNYRIVSGSSGNLNFKQVRIDPIERAVVFTLRDDQKLLPGEYVLRIKSSDDPANRLAAFDGAKFEGESLVRFVVGANMTLEPEIDPLAKDELPTREERARAAIGTLSASCTGARCHGNNSGSAPAMGLSLINPTAICATAFGRSSVLVQAPDDPSGGGRTTNDFPTGLPLIPNPSSGDGSARSFLLYKILMDYRLRADAECAPTDAACAKEMAAMTRAFAELRKRIPGAPMPHDTLGPDPSSSIFSPLPLASVRLLRRWIDEGAAPCDKTPIVVPTDAGADATGDTLGDAPGDTGAVTDSRADAPEGG